MTQLRDLVRRAPKRGLQFPSWLERLVSVGIVATDPQIVRRQRSVNMESHGVPDRIQLTKDAFDFEERGTTDLKGIGAARTFFLTGERSASQVLVAGRPAGECSGSRS
jgi:hypothetical protein